MVIFCKEYFLPAKTFACYLLQHVISRLVYLLSPSNRQLQQCKPEAFPGYFAISLPRSTKPSAKLLGARRTPLPSRALS